MLLLQDFSQVAAKCTMGSDQNVPHDPVTLEFREHVEAAKRLSELRRQIAYSQGYQLGPTPGGAPAFSGSEKDNIQSEHQEYDHKAEAVSTQSKSTKCNVDLDGFSDIEIPILFPAVSLKHQLTAAPISSDSSSKILADQFATGSLKFLEPSEVYSKLLEDKPQDGSSSRIVKRRKINAPEVPSRQSPKSTTPDPMIYPGLYAPSGFDMMSILIRVMQRPNPKIDIGFIDSSCAFCLCSTTEPDMPIVYCSDSFGELTGYTGAEMLGRNCRFLQSPTGHVIPGKSREHKEVDDGTLWDLKQKIQKGEESQTCLVNFRKNGERFENMLTTIPIEWSNGQKYIVGFQADRKRSIG